MIAPLIIQLIIVLLVTHAIVAFFLWQVQSRARRDDLIDIDLRDRVVALFWSRLCGWLLLYSAICWAWDAVRREQRA